MEMVGAERCKRSREGRASSIEFIKENHASRNAMPVLLLATSTQIAEEVVSPI
jgi:hypothetical protein